MTEHLNNLLKVLNLNNKYIKSLTSLRAFAALFVFIHHFNIFPDFGSLFLKVFYFQGYSGVSLFFVLSGFLIHRNYYENFRFNKISIKKYFVNRFARIYPMYLIIYILTTLAYSGERNFFNIITNLTLTKGFFDDHLFSGVATAWSLTVEETFYLLFPVILYFLRKNIKLLSILIFLYIAGLILVYIGSALKYEGFFSNLYFLFNYTFFGRSFEFIIGIMASRFLIEKNNTVLKTKNITYIAIFYIFIVYSFLSYIAYQNIVNGNYQFVASTVFIGLIIHNFLLPIGFAFLIIGLNTEKTVINKILELPTFEILGRSSYVFYLLQGGWFYTFYNQFKFTNSNLELLISMYIFSIICFKYLEEPINKKVKRLLINNNYIKNSIS